MKPKCSIIADPGGGAWKFAQEVYDWVRKRENNARLMKRESVVKGLENRIHEDCQIFKSVLGLLDLELNSESRFELNQVNVKVFPDGEPKPKILDNVREKKCFFIHDSSLEPCRWLAELIFVNGTLRNSSAGEINDVLPYLRFSRQDRKDETRVPISAKDIADILKADRVITLDVHNPAIQGFYNIPFDNLYSFPVVGSYLKKEFPEILENLVIMSPDAGGTQRAEAFARRFRIGEVSIGYKTREELGEVKRLKVLGEVEGKNVLIVDDILGSGGTLVKACEAARKLGAEKVYVYCTHALFTKGIDELTECLEGIFVGNTLNKKYEHEKIKVIDFAPLFGEAIYRVSEGESLSELFDRV